MKTRERQDLKKNELMDSLEQLQFFFQEHGSKVLAVAVIILVVILAGFYFVNNRRAAAVQAWEQLLANRPNSTGTKADDLRTLALTTSDRKAAAFAWKERGDALLMESMMADQAGKSVKELRAQAQQAYETVVSQYSDVTLAAAGAEMGLGVLYEDSLNWEKAKKTYEKINSDKALDGTGIPELAIARLALLATYEKSAATPLATTQSATTKKATTQKS